ncbi:uncharacterized protein LOC113360130 [Papaver somniferum]|uniref:uncharacterized protein LOC113360130 n=1 Tax=Papaver somniferum TaxID=3469 RepID=UPI000E6F97BB|nr:uncharacterized protein LOC113360130 [Papaver somniferum]
MIKKEYIRQEFAQLGIDGLEYHRWMADVKIAFVAKECTHTIIPSTEKDVVPATEQEKAEALRYLKVHIDPNLLWGYQHMMCPKELWDALASRFGSIEDCLLPQLNEQWNDIRFLDYVKTLSTFPLSSVILANQYRIEVDNKRITTFCKLINLLRVAERHNEVLANNNARVPGKKKIPEANYGKDNKGKHPKEKRVKNADSYSHAPYSRGDNNPRGRGQRGHRGKGHGRGGHWRGGHSNTWSREVTYGPSGRGNTVEKTHKNSMSKKQCKSSAKVAASYKKYRESIDQEAHCVEEHDNAPDVNFTISDFQGKKNHALMETPDFD